MSRRTPRAKGRRRMRGSFFHSKSLTCVKRVPVGPGTSRYSTRNTDAASSSSIVSRCGGVRSRCSTISSAAGRRGTGLCTTLQRRSPTDSTALTLRHQRGSFEGFETKSHTVSTGRAMATDSSTRITETVDRQVRVAAFVLPAPKAEAGRSRPKRRPGARERWWRPGRPLFASIAVAGLPTAIPREDSRVSANVASAHHRIRGDLG